MDDKEVLHRYLRMRRHDLLAKVDGLSDYDSRRPLTPTGTNLLGLIKHVASVQLGYFGEVFNRPSGRDFPWLHDDAAPEADLWLTAEETRDAIIELHHFSAAHADATIAALPLNAVGEVPWWSPERRRVTLQQILAHMCVETAQHLGHADILREQLDGATGRGPEDPNMPQRSPEEWAEHWERIETAARHSEQGVQ
jgi:uncharacterized damage-inducible protein DinB